MPPPLLRLGSKSFLSSLSLGHFEFVCEFEPALFALRLHNGPEFLECKMYLSPQGWCDYLQTLAL